MEVIQDYGTVKLRPSCDALDVSDSAFGRLIPFGTRYIVIETNASWRVRRDAYYMKRLAWYRADPRNQARSQEYAIRETLYRFYLIPRPKVKQRLIRVTGHIRN